MIKPVLAVSVDPWPINFPSDQYLFEVTVPAGQYKTGEFMMSLHESSIFPSRLRRSHISFIKTLFVLDSIVILCVEAI